MEAIDIFEAHNERDEVLRPVFSSVSCRRSVSEPGGPAGCEQVRREGGHGTCPPALQQEQPPAGPTPRAQYQSQGQLRITAGTLRAAGWKQERAHGGGQLSVFNAVCSSHRQLGFSLMNKNTPQKSRVLCIQACFTCIFAIPATADIKNSIF